MKPQIIALSVSMFMLTVGSSAAATYDCGNSDVVLEPDTVYSGNDDDAFRGCLNGSPSLVKFNSYFDEEEGKNVFGDGAEDSIQEGIAPGDYADNVTFDLKYKLDSEGNETEEIIGGTWFWEQDPGEFIPTLVAIKAGNNWFFYDFGEDGALEGDFSTEDLLDSKNVSHISFYDGAGTIVPLPAALPLMIGGLAGLGFLGTRRRKRI